MPSHSAPERTPAVPKPADVIDRDAVWSELSTAWTRPEPALLMGLGRRRAGKSWVLARFARAVKGIYYQATKRTESEQLADLSQIVGIRYKETTLTNGVSFPTWEALFAYLTDRAGTAPLLLILDEFPYLAEAAPGSPVPPARRLGSPVAEHPDQGRPQRLAHHGDEAA